jgi:ribosomal protein S18
MDVLPSGQITKAGWSVLSIDDARKDLSPCKAYTQEEGWVSKKRASGKEAEEQRSVDLAL